MAEYLGCDRFRELWLEIDQYHLNYLEADESPRKIDELRKLEGCIRKFLCIAPHDRKFCFRVTSEVLRRTVERKSDVPPGYAKIGWSAIAAYAHNLLAQPWRKEFHEIKMYCGYYKHNIEMNLVGAELMLEAMGYKHTGYSSMILDGPVDPDRVVMVSRDSLIARVECQIISDIYTRCILTSLTVCTYLEALQYRETHICSVEKAAEDLSKMYYQRTRYDRNRVRRSDPTTHHKTLPPVGGRPFPQVPRYGVVSSVQTLPPAYHPMYHMKPHVVYAPSPYYPIQNGYIPLPVPPPPVMVPSYPCSVPTGQLIEIDVPHDNQTYSANMQRGSLDNRIESDPRKICDRYDSDVNHSRSTPGWYQPDVHSRTTASGDVGSKKSGKSKNGNWDSWAYVYQRLEEKNSVVKDELLDRKKENKRPPSPMDLDDALKAFSLDDFHQIAVPETRPMKINEALNKVHIEPDVESKRKELNNRVSIYDNSSPPATNNSPKQTQTIAREPKKNDDAKFLSMDSRKLRVKLNDNKWECVTCTFHNVTTRDVCEMCGKSRRSGGESRPLASGGRQCPQCTLVNEKGVTTCDACGASLKDSPTYI